MQPEWPCSNRCVSSRAWVTQPRKRRVGNRRPPSRESWRVRSKKYTSIISARACSLTIFFFSSRRRHTRFDCDWSSDVCSSDLCVGPVGLPGRRHVDGSPLRRPHLPAPMSYTLRGRLESRLAALVLPLGAAYVDRKSVV